MGIRESLLNTITSVADSDFVRIVTSAGASSKATVRNLFKGFESNLGAKSSLTNSDYIRVVGSDNEAYKQSMSSVSEIVRTNLNYPEISGNTQAAFETALNARFQDMKDGEVALVRAYPNWGASFTAGARATAALYRITSSLYKCCILDAHLWDGYYYSDAWHWNSEIDKLNTRTNVQNGNALDSFDLNNLTNTTVYQFDKLTSAMTNAPNTGTYFSGFLFVERYAANKVLQTFYYAGGTPAIYARTLWNGTWGAWGKI